jgi:hypothetical protein
MSLLLNILIIRVIFFYFYRYYYFFSRNLRLIIAALLFMYCFITLSCLYSSCDVLFAHRMVGSRDSVAFDHSFKISVCDAHLFLAHRLALVLASPPPPPTAASPLDASFQVDDAVVAAYDTAYSELSCLGVFRFKWAASVYIRC